MIDLDKLSDGQRAQLKLGRKPNKYRARQAEHNGTRYDSKLEAKHAAELAIDPNVLWWLRQVWIPLGPDFRTRVDFVVGFHGWWSSGPTEFIVKAHECKGYETRQFRKVRQLWPKYGPFDLCIITKGDVEIVSGR